MKKNVLLIIIFCFLIFTSLSGKTSRENTIGEPKQDVTSKSIEESPKEKKKLPQKKAKTKDSKKEKQPVMHYQVTVTATGTNKDTFDTPKPVSVVGQNKISQKAPNNVAELLTDLPGTDVVGVGTNQSRPVIRGMRGQRILLMEDAIRMNNSRRQQDFGEIPGIIDTAEVEKIEVVRGPASVLYGSDAIGGVVNIITKFPGSQRQGKNVHGTISYRHSTFDNQNKGFASLHGNLGKLNFRLSGTYRQAKETVAPAGTFGNIKLTDNTMVTNSGVKDGNFNLILGYNPSADSAFSFKYEHYNASDAGFGLVEPELYSPGEPRIEILYPHQQVNRFILNYQNRKLGVPFADHLTVTAYRTLNERDLDMNIWVSFNIPKMPAAGVSVESNNFTDISTYGFRMELNKAASKAHVVTYGLDFFKDNSVNTDEVTTTMMGFGPPDPQFSDTPQVPNAYFQSLGLFIQDDFTIFSRLSLILGLRYQSITTSTRETTGLEGEMLGKSNDSTLVGAVNVIYGLTRNFKLVLTVGRGFRSPNLIESFFDGFTPEGTSYQSRNLDLKAETSLNVDIGFKFRLPNLFVEAYYFNNTIYDGIRVVATGEKVFGFNEYQNQNIDKLRMQGIELVAGVYLNVGISVNANYTKITSKDLIHPDKPHTNTYSTKLNLNLHYQQPNGIFWADYQLRINGDQKDILLEDNPIGDIIPGFTVHNISAGVFLFKKSGFSQKIGVTLGNLTNALYSEFSNATFFRPAPRRHLVITWTGSF